MTRKRKYGMDRRIGFRRQWLRSGLVLFLCSMLGWGGCVQSYDTAMYTSHEYPCANLARVQKRYDRLKEQGSPESDLRQLLRQIRRLQERCTAYRNEVERYVESSGYTQQAAERKAAEVPRSAPTTYESHPETGTWVAIGVVSGITVLTLAGLYVLSLLAESGIH